MLLQSRLLRVVKIKNVVWPLCRPREDRDKPRFVQASRHLCGHFLRAVSKPQQQKQDSHARMEEEASD